MNLEFTEAAISDLRSIRAYTLEKWGKEQEQLYLDRLWTKFGEIASNPSRSRLRNDFFPDCQLAVEGKHVILFRVKKGVLQIVRVLHSAMDFKRHIPSRPDS